MSTSSLLPAAYDGCNPGDPCTCEDCGWRGPAEDLDWISDPSYRLDPGGVVPAGQCPECGALAYLDD